jgi:hypothetical protein
MEAVQSEGVAVEGAEGVLLTSLAGIRIRAVVSPKASLSKTAPEQSPEISWSAYAGTPQSRVHLLSKISDLPRRLNRQIAQLETTLTSRKQRSANCSNRQKIQFRKSQNPSAVFAKPWPAPFSRLATSHLLALTKEGPLACPDEGRATVVSNRELLVLETPQPAENKHRRTVLIENFEPNRTPQLEGRSK